MAMGKPRQFPVEYEECVKAIEEYKNKVEQEVIRKPSMAGFLGTIGASMQEYMEVIEKPNSKNIPLSNLLKSFGTWMDGEIIERSGGPNGSMAIFLLKQGFGGYKYTDRQEIKADTKTEVKVSFGGKNKDPFG